MDEVEKRVERVEALVSMGEISAARQAVEGSPFAPDNQDTLDTFMDEYRRPPVPRDPIPEDVLRSVPDRPFELDKEEFLHSLRTARRGAAGRPPGMRTEHLRPLSDNEEESNKFFEVAQSFAQANIPEEILAVLRVGQMTALQKPNGGVRGMVVGDVVRRLVAKTMAKQFVTRFETATKPFQHALATRAGCESIAHAVQVVTDMDPRATVLSIDGVGAFDLISRRAMMCAVQRMPDGETILPSVLQFYGHPSTHLWEDEEGVVHEIPQGEGGEQGDPLMRPCLLGSAPRPRSNPGPVAAIRDVDGLPR